MMGGIATDAHARATLAGLHAVGECSCTGLHGANRLASNSLTECFVFGGRAATAALGEPAAGRRPSPPAWRFEPPSEETRDAVWRLAGPIRRPDELRELQADPYPLARAIATCALERRESRGGHLRVDCPGIDHALDGTHLVLAANGEVRREEWL
jgi:L-aspartate oxidase